MPASVRRPTAAAAGRTIAEVGEFGFLAGMLPGLSVDADTLVGPGQDCAVIRCGTSNFLFTIDALTEGVHFRSNWLTPRQVGRRSFLVNASDTAAMGGRPRFCVVGLGVPAAYLERDLRQVQAGIVEAAGVCGATVVGGNLSQTPQLSVTIALLASAPRRIVTRQHARPGDYVYVTGTVGDAALAVRLLGQGDGSCPPAILRRYREPTARLRAGELLVASGLASAMIDISDGLVQDLGHICEESGVGAIVYAEQVPRSRGLRKLMGLSDTSPLCGGEDYELMCTVPARRVARLERSRAQLGCPITCVGRITSGDTVVVADRQGNAIDLRSRGGFDHFAGGARAFRSMRSRRWIRPV